MAVEELKDAMMRGAVEAGASQQEAERIIAPALEQLQREHGGHRVYIDVIRQPPCYPIERIREAVMDGESVRAICARFHIDRRSLYRLLDESD